MKGNANYQVQQLYATVNEIGTSKHTAKAEARDSGAKTFHDIAKQDGIHSYNTADAYRDVWRAVADTAKTDFGVKDLEKLTSEHVNAFLSDKVNEGIARATFDQYASAVEKLETALNRYADAKGSGNKYKFDLKATRQEAAIELGERAWQARAYTDPKALIDSVQGQYKLAAQIQHESGGRVREVSQIRPDQLRGLKVDERTGKLKGWVQIKGKGGKTRDLGVSPKTYKQIEAAVAGGKTYKVDSYSAYTKALGRAAAATGQQYNGSHGIRWNAAQEYMAACQKNGMKYEEALKATSQMLGHERASITERYLKA